MHLEEDAGKSLHDGFVDSDRKTYVDYNRAGTPLIEIVTEPDLRTAAHGAEFFSRLRTLLVWLGINDGNMEEGSLRCDANVSVRPAGAGAFGTKAEVKNLNSFRYLQKALEYEIDRQIEVVRSGRAVVQETRLWDAAAARTYSMRSKEEAHDYRYFPDPDLVPLKLEREWVDAFRADLPELPAARTRRFLEEYGLPDYDAGVLTATREVAEYFEASVKLFPQPKTVSNWVMGELMRELNTMGTAIGASPVSPDRLTALLRMVENGSISLKVARDLFPEMYRTGKTPEQIVDEKGLTQVSDEGALRQVIDEVLTGNPTQVAQFKQGKQQVLGFLVGQVMKASGGKANPGKVNELLKKRLG